MKKVTAADIHADFKSAVNTMTYESSMLSKLKQAGFNKKVEIDNILSEVSIRYPNHKMIYDNQVKSLCKKYNLVLADMDRYIGSIPEKNLNEILEFRKMLKYNVIWTSSFWSNEKRKMFNSLEEAELFRLKKDGWLIEDHDFKIIAPFHDIHLEKNESVINYEIQVDDPIVL